MSEEKPQSLEDVLFQRTVLAHAMFTIALRLPYSEDDALLFAEKAMIAMQRKKNHHLEKHSAAYDVACIFCVDLIHESNIGFDLPRALAWRNIIIDVAERFISRDVWDKYKEAVREAEAEFDKKGTA